MITAMQFQYRRVNELSEKMGDQRASINSRSRDFLRCVYTQIADRGMISEKRRN